MDTGAMGRLSLSRLQRVTADPWMKRTGQGRTGPRSGTCGLVSTLSRRYAARITYRGIGGHEPPYW